MPEQVLLNIGPGHIQIAFERFGQPTWPPVILIMGGGAQMIAWPEGFCHELVRQGLQPIRFDNRNAGLSTHFSQAPVPDFMAAMAGDFSTVPYTLSLMAVDTIGLMDALGFDSAHLVGASMGGMIAQTIAIEYPERVRSLTSLMSSTGDPSVGQYDPKLFAQIGQPPTDREGYIEWRVKTLELIGSPGYPFDAAAAREMAGLAWDRDHDPVALLRQSVAVIQSGDRTSKLQHLNVPSLVMHGKADKLIDVSGGIATAKAIPHSRLVLFDGMGHSLPQALWEQMAKEIARLIWFAEG